MAHASSSSSAAPLGPKASHYNTALTGALLKGRWGDNTAGAAPNGTELSWGELVRKWGKHTGGNTELVHRLRDISLLYLSTSSLSSSGFISVPPPSQSSPAANTSPGAPGTSATPSSTPRAGGSNASDETNTSTSASSFIHVPHPHLRRHKSRPSTDAGGSGSTITATQHGRGISPAAGNRAAYLSAGDLDGDDPSDGNGWSIDGGWHGISSDGVEEAKEGVKALEGLIAGGKLRSGEMQSAKVILGYYLHALGSHEDAIRILSEVSGDIKVGLVDGDAAVLDRIRARLLIGLCAELQQEPDPRLALNSYTSILPLVSAMSTLPTATPSYMSTNSSVAKQPFDTHREVHRIVSSALCRAAILAARMPNNVTQVLRICRSYHTFSSSWATSFRPLQRQRMLQLYIRALYSGYPAPNTSPDTPYTLDETLASPPTSARALWQKEAIEAIRQGRSLLSATTSFPRAGSINAPVTQFTNLCVALADRCAGVQREVASVLWWAMSLTFQSQSILRHLTRLQTSLGDSTDAKRTFQLYVQLVLKSRETHQPEISLQLKRRVVEDHPASPETIKQEAEEAEGVPGQEERQSQVAENEADSNAELVEALLVGTKLLLKDLGEVEDAWRYVTLAGDVVDIANQPGADRLSSVLRGEVEEWKGLVRMAMAMKGADRTTRPKYQAQAVNHLKAATELNPTSALAFYHLAMCQAQARSVDAASESIRRSLELDSRSVQSWHLLSLILTAQKDWEAAAKAGEAGVSVWESHEEAELVNEEAELVNEEAAVSDDPNVSSKDFASSFQSPQPITNEPILLPSGTFHPPHIDSKPPASALTRAKRLENVIKLRMTLNVIAEKMAGTEIAMLRQQELFAFFSARSGKNRSSVGGGLGGLKGSTSFTSVPGSAGKEDLGGSYISINVDERARTGEMEQEGGARAAGTNDGLTTFLQPPTPIVEEIPTGSRNISETGNASLVSTAVAGTIPRPLGSPIGQGQGHGSVLSTISTPGGSAGTSEAGSADERDKFGSARSGGKDTSEKGSHGHGRDSRKLLGTKRLVAKHLHVPHGGSGRSSRPSSVRRLQLPEDLRSTVQRSRNASTSSTALSIAPTAVHSHFRGSNAPSAPAPPPIQTKAPSEHTATELRILSNLWLMSAATFRRWSKPDQSLVSIEEAEVLDPENPDVWVQLGLYHLSLSPPNTAAALPAYTKALLLRPDHPPSLVNLSKLYIQLGKVELAHSLLNQMTQDAGWDVPEAWFYLGKVCEIQGRVERARACWKYALELEETRPARRWDVCL